MDVEEWNNQVAAKSWVQGDLLIGRNWLKVVKKGETYF
jgi:hypothetical protein